MISRFIRLRILYCIACIFVLCIVLFVFKQVAVSIALMGMCISLYVVFFARVKSHIKYISIALLLCASAIVGMVMVQFQSQQFETLQAQTLSVGSLSIASLDTPLDITKVNSQYQIAPQFVPSDSIDTLIARHKSIFSPLELSTQYSRQFRVTDILSSSTIKIEDVGYVQLLGLDTPMRMPRTSCIEEIATQRMSDIMTGKNVYLEFDQDARYDAFGRVLAYVYVESGLSINALLLQDGLAYNIDQSLSPHFRLNEYKLYEREARLKPSGVWVDGVCEVKQQEVRNASSSSRGSQASQSNAASSVSVSYTSEKSSFSSSYSVQSQDQSNASIVSSSSLVSLRSASTYSSLESSVKVQNNVYKIKDSFGVVSCIPAFSAGNHPQYTLIGEYTTLEQCSTTL